MEKFKLTPEILEYIDKRFAVLGLEKPPVSIYMCENTLEFDAAVGETTAEWVLACCVGKKIYVKPLKLWPNAADISSILCHELAHAYYFHYVQFCAYRYFADESVALLVAGQYLQFENYYTDAYFDLNNLHCEAEVYARLSCLVRELCNALGEPKTLNLLLTKPDSLTNIHYLNELESFIRGGKLCF